VDRYSDSILVNAALGLGVALENLAVYLALIVTPDPGTRPREDRLDRQQEPHLPGFEDTALRVDERMRSPSKTKPGLSSLAVK
jgi:hypothetical protein